MQHESVVKKAPNLSMNAACDDPIVPLPIVSSTAPAVAGVVSDMIYFLI